MKQIRRLAEQKIVHIRQTELGDIVYLKSEDSALIGYYRNNSLHSLIIPAFIACCFTNIRRVSNASIKRKIGLLYPFLESELQLEWQESELADVIDQFITCLVDASLLERVKNDLRRPPRHSRRFIQLIRLGHVVQPILERYYMTFVVLWQTSAAPLVEAELEHRCHLLAQKISMIYGINSPDFFDRLLFRDFINTALKSEYLVKNDQLQLELKQGFNYASLDLRNLLSTEVRSSILSLIKTTPH
jgi:glycerol-3-phosphate O-acyltransferase